MSFSLAMLLSESARNHRERTALVYGAERISYGDLWQQTRALADVLRARYHVTEGDRVALLCPNTPDFVRAYYAVLALGGVVVPMHTMLTPHELAYMLADCEAKLLLCHESIAQGTESSALADIPLHPLDDRAISVSSEIVAEPAEAGALDDAVILYTSGTSGKPKGAVLSHSNLLMNAAVTAFDLVHLTPQDVVLGALPFFHIAGMSIVMNAALRAGCTLALAAKFNGPEALEIMIREGVTFIAGNATLFIPLIEAARRETRRPPVRHIHSGGSPLPIAALEAMQEAFGTPVEEGYGLTEASPVVCYNQPQIGIKPGTVGTPVWGVQVAIADPSAEDCIRLLPPAQSGEIVVRGHGVFSRYLNDPQATAKVKVDGWLRTGDIGAFDDDGFLTILDRKHDLILRSGFNIYPREVEEVLLRHPAVHEAAVIGVPHNLHGEEVCALIVRSSEAGGIAADEIILWARENMGKDKYPRLVHFVEELPRTQTGKVRRRELAVRYSSVSISGGV